MKKRERKGGRYSKDGKEEEGTGGRRGRGRKRIKNEGRAIEKDREAKIKNKRGEGGTKTRMGKDEVGEMEDKKRGTKMKNKKEDEEEEET